MKSFLPKLIVFSLITLGVLVVWHQFIPAKWSYEYYWAVWLFFVLSTWIIHTVLSKATKTNPKEFVFYFLTTTGAKFLLYLIIIAIFAYVQKPKALGFATIFFLMYLFYSVFEVMVMLRIFKQVPPKGSQPEA